MENLSCHLNYIATKLNVNYGAELIVAITVYRIKYGFQILKTFLIKSQCYGFRCWNKSITSTYNVVPGHI